MRPSWEETPSMALSRAEREIDEVLLLLVLRVLLL